MIGCGLDGMNTFNILLVLFATVYGATSSSTRTYKRLAKGEVESSPEEDSKGEETEFAESDNFGGFDDGGGGGRYFMYQHVPQKDHYEFGFKRGNDHHHKERHEKAHPHAGHFKTKVKWGDIHGGHGEHYWDYNHHGNDEGEADEASETVLDYDKMEEGRKKRDERTKGPVLMYNPETGTVKDETTGKIYALYEL
ncbi:uncharacterized protein LOC106667530 [Cimex lectularius]|uniref:CPR type cuticle protein n=1 Tax=Cimex lectularius TaxID=79782 RepID=A0A8I6RT25_CIMLE|nr:uncharacterized protein LOC106667530 [Cimex lectularius]